MFSTPFGSFGPRSNAGAIAGDDGEVRIILDEDSLGDTPTTATFKGPREEQGFDFNCVANVSHFTSPLSDR